MNNTFPGFGYMAWQLSSYINYGDSFVLALITTEVVRFTAPDAAAFREWLAHHGIKDRTKETGTLVLDYYFRSV